MTVKEPSELGELLQHLLEQEFAGEYKVSIRTDASIRTDSDWTKIILDRTPNWSIDTMISVVLNERTMNVHVARSVPNIASWSSVADFNAADPAFDIYAVIACVRAIADSYRATNASS